MTKKAQVEVRLEKKQDSSGDGRLLVFTMDGDGSALGNVEVTISGPVTKSASSGSANVAEFEGIPVGNYDITAQKSGYKKATTSVNESQFA